jgi:LysM repeat protein
MYKQDPRQTAVREQSPLRRVTVAYRNASKQTRRALLISLVALIGLVSIASAYSYTVQNGDTLYSIARHNNTTVDQLGGG